MSGVVEELMLAGQPAYSLRNAQGDQVVVLRQGGQVLSWMTADGVERLYQSPIMPQAAGQAVRGGVPVIFPQFNQRGPDFTLPRHGFARQLPWMLLPTDSPALSLPISVGVPSASADARDEDPQVARLSLQLTDSEATQRHWPFAFVLRLDIRLSPGSLSLGLSVENRTDQPMSFTAALHTYLAVSDLLGAQLHGLAGVERLDTLQDQAGLGALGPLVFDGPIDDIYFDVSEALFLDSDLGRLKIAMSGGFTDTVIWNPGEFGAEKLVDLPTEDWRQMLCVEAACIGRPAQVAPGGHWGGMQVFTVLNTAS
ncbi:MAG: D-hexose-6-phosphate mutarotase [Lautropia sp.]|nr:D-hexose-6-phosphate mutarotase [Lautropia sp.]